MTTPRGIVLALLSASASTCSAQSVPGVPMTAKILLENSTDGRTYRLVSATEYFRDALGRVRSEESLFDASAVAVKRTVRIALAGEGGRLVVYTLDPAARTGTRTEVPLAQFSQAPPPPHHHPEDGTRFSNLPSCAVGVQRWSEDFPRIEIVRCTRISPGVNRRFKKDGVTWRETIAEAQSAQPPASLFEVPAGYSIRDAGALQQQARNEALRKFYQLQPPPRQTLLPPPQLGAPELRNPTFVPGQECDEFRLAGKEPVTWNCKEKEPLLLRIRARGAV